ncbi:MAG: tRNA uridine-5-carboxymethylaminomethyl(34) synthesis GTPase MnmE [Candidatus Latescibacterota bacterium]
MLASPETIVAVSTPAGQGGVGLVRLSGPDAIRIGQRIVRCRAGLGRRARHVEYGRVVVQGQEIDTALAWVLKGPRSYTGEDTVEISCHGSRAVLSAIVEEAVRHGAVVARPGEFTRRAFLNGKMDLLEAEAVVDLVRAESLHGVAAAYGQASGSLSRMVAGLRAGVVGVAARLEAVLDFPEESDVAVDLAGVWRDLGRLAQRAQDLADTFTGAARRHEGVVVAIIGRPNVGKSTLLNRLLGEPRAIVTPVAGTTRDLVEGRTTWSGDSVLLVDTAGLREGGEAVEREGVRRAREVSQSASLVLAVLDGAQGWGAEEAAVLSELGERRCVVVLNKADLGLRKGTGDAELGGRPCVAVSALSGQGMGSLVAAVGRWLPRSKAVEGVSIVRQRHHACIVRVASKLREAAAVLGEGAPIECAAEAVREGCGALGELLGEGAGEEVLERIFAEFCVGK